MFRHHIRSGLLVFALLVCAGSAGANSSESSPAIEPAKTLSDLREANKRFVDGKMKHPNQTATTRHVLTGGQHPQSVILSCSDSRVPPEVIFDSGLGDLFVVRSAGEIADDVAIASIEYAVEHLGSKLIVVLGHESCGAVKATLTTKENASAGSSSLDHLVARIRANIGKGAEFSPSDPRMTDAVLANADATMQSLSRRSKLLREKLEKHEILIVTAMYHLEDGKVEFRQPVDGLYSH